MSPCRRSRRRSYVMAPREYAASCRPTKAANSGRRSRFWKPSGTREKRLMACSSACTRGSPKRSAETRRSPRKDRLLELLKTRGLEAAGMAQAFGLEQAVVDLFADRAQVVEGRQRLGRL